MNAKKRASDKDPDKTGAIASDEMSDTDTPERPVPTDSAAKAEPAGKDRPDDQQALQAEIEQTRAELGETVEALSAKADVKAQAKDKVEEGKARLRDQQAQAKAKFGEVSEQAKSNPAPFAAAAGGVVALLLLVRRIRRR